MKGRSPASITEGEGFLHRRCGSPPVILGQEESAASTVNLPSSGQPVSSRSYCCGLNRSDFPLIRALSLRVIRRPGRRESRAGRRDLPAARPKKGKERDPCLTTGTP